MKTPLFPALGMLALAAATSLSAAVAPSDAEAGAALERLSNRMDVASNADWDTTGALLRAAVQARPDDEDAAGALYEYFYLYEGHHSLPESARAWAQAARSANTSVAQEAARKAAFFAWATTQPVDFAFTAADGRHVDLAALRGKVVMLDFWATWCGPCLGELPYVKAAYARFHDQGFDIVGVSCDVSPANKPGADWTRTAAQVVAFTKTNGMPWPQHYEGRKHNAGGNTVAARFAVQFIPECFLIGPDGRIAAMGLRGLDLSAAIERLLAGRHP